MNIVFLLLPMIIEEVRDGQDIKPLPIFLDTGLVTYDKANYLVRGHRCHVFVK